MSKSVHRRRPSATVLALFVLLALALALAAFAGPTSALAAPSGEPPALAVSLSPASAGGLPGASSAVEGTAVPAQLAFTPGALDFGPQARGSGGAGRTLIVRNDGDAAVALPRGVGPCSGGTCADSSTMPP